MASKIFAVLCPVELKRVVASQMISTANDSGSLRSSARSELQLIDPDPESGRDWRTEPAETVPLFEPRRDRKSPFEGREDVDQRLLVKFDKQSSRDHNSCLICDRKPATAHISSVRVNLDIALDALQALARNDVDILQLRNRAMIQGGILATLENSETASDKPEALKEIEGLQQSKQPPPEEEEDERKILPIFLTADIGELLSKFETDFNASSTHLQWMYATSTSVQELVERFSHGEGQKNSSQPFQGASTDDVIKFSQNNFPGWNIKSKMFLVLDEHTLKGRGVLIGQFTGEHGLQLMRTPIPDAKLVVVSTEINEPPIEETVSQAIEQSDGVAPQM